MLFWKESIFFFLLVLGGGAFFSFSLTQISQKDKELYKALSEQTLELRSKKALEREPTMQQREVLQKDLWTAKEGARKHIQISAETSNLFVKEKKDRIEAFESLKNLSCFYVENDAIDPKILYASSAKIIYPEENLFLVDVEYVETEESIKAKKAKLETKDQKTLRFSEGVRLESVKGGAGLSLEAEYAHSNLDEKNITFSENVKIFLPSDLTAKGDKALYTDKTLTLLPEGQKSCTLSRLQDEIEAAKAIFSFETETLFLESPNGKFQSNDEVLSFSSDSLLWNQKESQAKLIGNVKGKREDGSIITSKEALLSIENDQIEKVTFEGDVEIFSPFIQKKDCYCIANTVLLFPKEKTLHLKADPSKRVLLWQDDLSLSAPEARITQDGKIESQGDVHFTLTIDEQNSINQLLSKYL